MSTIADNSESYVISDVSTDEIINIEIILFQHKR